MSAPALDVLTVDAAIRCPIPGCGETVEVSVGFLSPGPDTGGHWAAEVDDGWIGQHLTAAHGAPR